MEPSSPLQRAHLRCPLRSERRLIRRLQAVSIACCSRCQSGTDRSKQMQITFLKGYPDYVGKRFIWCGYGNGPASYVVGGDPLYFSRFNNYIDIVESSGVQTISGNFTVAAVPSAVGARAAWKLKWLFAPQQDSVNGVLIATAGTGQTNGTYTAAA